MFYTMLGHITTRPYRYKNLCLFWIGNNISCPVIIIATGGQCHYFSAFTIHYRIIFVIIETKYIVCVSYIEFAFHNKHSKRLVKVCYINIPAFVNTIFVFIPEKCDTIGAAKILRLRIKKLVGFVFLLLFRLFGACLRNKYITIWRNVYPARVFEATGKFAYCKSFGSYRLLSFFPSNYFTEILYGFSGIRLWQIYGLRGCNLCYGTVSDR